MVGGLLEKVKLSLQDLKEQLICGSSGYSVYNTASHNSNPISRSNTADRDGARSSSSVDETDAAEDNSYNNQDDNDVDGTTVDLDTDKLRLGSRSGRGSRWIDATSSSAGGAFNATGAASSSKSEMLDHALLDMCGNLEEENARLHDHIGMQTNELNYLVSQSVTPA